MIKAQTPGQQRLEQNRAELDETSRTRETHSAGGEVILMCRTADGAEDLVASSFCEAIIYDLSASGRAIDSSPATATR